MFQQSQNIILIALMTGLTCVGGFIKIPFLPVPITLQTLFVYLSGTLLGPWRGLASQTLYLLIGLAGFPVFTAGGGPAYVLHPTFGYLFGFPLAAWLTGILFQRRQKKCTIPQIFLCLMVGMGIILALGIVGLAVNTRWIAGKSVDLMHLLWAGGLILLPGEIAKMLLASQLIMRFRPLIAWDTP